MSPEQPYSVSDKYNESIRHGELSSITSKTMFVLPSSHAEETQMYHDAVQLRRREHTLEERKSALEGKTKVLEDLVKQLEQQEADLRSTLQRTEADIEKLDKNCDFVLSFEPPTIERQRENHVQAYRDMRAAKERVVYLEGNIRRGEFKRVLEELEGSETEDMPKQVETSDEAEVGGDLTRLNSPRCSMALSLENEDKDATALKGETREGDEENEGNVLAKDTEVGVRPPRVTPVAFPDEPVPEWFRAAFHCLNVSIGYQYLVLVGHWVTIERLKGWETPKRGLTARFRPQELRQFMQRGKFRWEYGPDTGKDFVYGFSSRVQEWWSFLLEKSRGGWQSLNHSGQNGWCLLLISMKWWATGLVDMEDARERKQAERIWKVTLKGMNEAAQGLIAFLEGGE
ncbi:hypothetical protein V5O48_015645 [Marasmius crinis-equi]|uniref:Uncharacterized protein n=1 Tax=Marasmius crinis-equi TaxID=585013 RepID=A0ABR3ETZ7_9AGAR